jgi:hypothetical protein
MKSKEKKVNEFTPMEKLMYSITEMKEGTNDTRKKKVLSDVTQMIQNIILDDIEENLFIKFYVMTRLFVVNEMTEEDVDMCYLEATASFQVMFNAKSMFEDSNEYQSKNN